MITLTAGSTQIQLSNQLSWLNEFVWSPLETTTEYSLTGSLIVQQGLKQAGQPIELGCHGVQKSLIDSLNSIKGFIGEMQLSFRNNTYAVVWDKTPFEAQPILKNLIEPKSTDWYSLKLNFLIMRKL